MNFKFSWQEQYLTRLLRSLMRFCSCLSQIKFISSRHRVISSIYFIGVVISYNFALIFSTISSFRHFVILPFRVLNTPLPVVGTWSFVEFIWPTIMLLEWGICTFWTQDDFPGARHLNGKTDLSSDPPLRVCFSPCNQKRDSELNV